MWVWGTGTVAWGQEYRASGEGHGAGKGTGGSEGYLWGWRGWGYLWGLCKGVRWFSTSGYHLLTENGGVCLTQEVSHRGGLGTTCGDEGILTGNYLITLSHTP